jgi:hypothetical protein
MAEKSLSLPRGSSTIRVPIDKDRYQQIVADSGAFRRFLDECFAVHPELFPEAFASGYRSKDCRTSEKMGVAIRRIECKADGSVFSIQPSFVMPYLTGYTDEVAHPLFLRTFGVPYWALAQVFGRDASYWQRLETSLGRNSLVGATVRTTTVPEHLAADEHHQTLQGEKVYIATTVAEGCCLGASVASSADEPGLTEAYGTFKQEAQNVQPGYKPQTVNTDGWKATRLAWLALFPFTLIIRCFLHGWLSIRERCKKEKHYKEAGDKIWHAYKASDKRSMAQRLRRLREWAAKTLKGVFLEKVLNLCKRSEEYQKGYEHEGTHRTSNMLDRVMKKMNQYFDGCQHLHGTRQAAEKHCRAWALLHNFAPWSPAAVKANDGWLCPVQRLNQHRYHSNWLHNLLVSSSLAGFRRPLAPPHNPV